MKTRNIILWILFLVIIDQVIKIIINAFFLESHFEIIPSLLEFKPTFNTKHSYVNSLLYKHLSINMGLFLHVIIFVVGGLIMTILYLSFRRNILAYTKLLDFSMVMLYSGIICALLGNLIWKNGTLDYIYLKPLFVFDLKDIYLNIYVILFLIYLRKIGDKIKDVSLKGVGDHIKSYFRSKHH